MNSNGESAVETCEENVVVEWGKQCELLQHNETSAVAGMISASDSVSKNAVCKALPGISDESISDDNVAYSKSDGRRVLEGHHDCFSWDIGADEHAKNKSEIEDSRIKYGGINQISAEISDKMPYSSSPTGLSSQHSGLLEIPPSKSIDDATVLHCIFSHASNGKCVLHNSNSRDIEDDKPSDTKGEFLEASTDILNSLLTTELASDIASGDPPAPDLNPMEKKDDMEVEIQPIDEIDESDMVEHDVRI